MDEGLALAVSAVEQHAGAGKLSQVVVLTDGETSGEQNCRSLARQAAAKKIHLTLMGVGLDWKAALLKDLAQLSQGKWYYIEVNESQETARIFAEEFRTLAASAFLDVELCIRPVRDVTPVAEVPADRFVTGPTVGGVAIARRVKLGPDTLTTRGGFPCDRIVLRPFGWCWRRSPCSP